MLIGGLDWLFGGERGIGCLVVKEGWVVNMWFGLLVWWSKRDWLFGGERGIGCLVVKEGLVVWW